MNPRVIAALVTRYLLLYVRSVIRGVEVIFWPMVDLLVWGFLTTYLQKHSDIPHFITYLIGAMILWDVMFRAQQAVAISFLEDVWNRNLLNIFAAPIRVGEYIGATFVLGVIRVAVTVVVLTLVAWFVYRFNLFDLKLSLIPLFANLLLFGWALGMISVALILRFGHGAESLAWAVPFFIQPISAVFYPVSALPKSLQSVANWLPSTYSFEAMRESLNSGAVRWDYFAKALGLNLLYLAMAFGLFFWVISIARKRGALAKFGSD